MVILALRILSCVMAALAALLNGAVCCVIIRSPELYKIANWFVLSLSVADFCLGASSTVLSFFVVEGLKGHQIIMVYFLWFIISASITNLCCMVADRYLAVVWPLKYNSLMTARRAFFLIFTAWLLPLLFVVGNFLRAEIAGDPRHAEKLWIRAHAYLVVIMALSSTFLVVATVHTISIARKRSRENVQVVAQLRFNHPLESRAVATVNSTSRVRASVVLIVVVVANFFVCFSLRAYTDVCVLLPLCDAPSTTVFLVSLLLFVTNSALNPVAYSCARGEIRRKLLRLFCRNRRQDVVCQPL